MSEDEAHHGTTAELAGGVELPYPVRRIMALGGNLLRNCSPLDLIRSRGRTRRSERRRPHGTAQHGTAQQASLRRSLT